MSESREVNTFIRKRASIKARLTLFGNFVNALQGELENLVDNLPDLKLIDLEQRITRNVSLINEYDAVQEQIDCLVDEDGLDKQFTEREAFESSYNATMALAKKLASENRHVENNSVGPSPEYSINNLNNSSNNSCSTVKLPTINLPKFDGSYDSWLEFRDTFQSLIHSNASINEIQKFHYLRASLTGGAAQVIKSIEFSAANYFVAWDILCSRFDNNRLLIHSHVKALFSLETITKESAFRIRKLIDTVSKHLRSLETLNQPTSQWDTLIIFMITSKLDNITLRHWEEYKADNDVPTLENLKQFLKSRADLLETLELNNSEKRGIKQNLTTKSFFAGNLHCTYCNGEHFIYNCSDFLKLGPNERMEQVKKLKLCINCLKSNHFSKGCSAGKCKKCNAKHNTLLHVETNQNPTATVGEATVSLQSVKSSDVTQQQVLLSTALVQVVGKNQVCHTARALLDAGSQSSFITADLCDLLQLKKARINISVAGIHNVISKIDYRCETRIKAQHNSFSKNISFFVLSNITGNLPNSQLDLKDLPIPKNIKLADPGFNKPSKIDILIGADHFWDLICIGQVRLGNNLPLLQKTRFGWVVSGPIYANISSTIHCNFNRNLDIQEKLQHFWEIEEVPSIKQLSLEEAECEAHFQRTFERTSDRRFIVSLPFKEPHEVLGESREQAQRRFMSLEKRLSANTITRRMYHDFLQEYESMGHMTKLSKIDDDIIAYYMPHHGVVREESTTTKLRVVFDASASTTTGKSLNDIQMVGPVIQDDLLSILLRFRVHRYVVSADIAKMYRQVLVKPEQRPLQRILWRSDPSQPLHTYELNTVTYGTAAASFLAIRCLHQLAEEHKAELPHIARIIDKDFYVDDLLTGAETIEEAKKICQQISAVLASGCFELRKWTSNEPAILDFMPNVDSNSTFDFGSHEQKKTLGLIWSCHSDTLAYTINETNETRVTKRLMLSSISQIFDPLGLLSPCIIIAKIMLQELWQEKLTWDESLPAHLHTRWTKFCEELSQLSNLYISRQVICHNPKSIEIHGFSDASEGGYGACIYIRSSNTKGETVVRLLCSKSKVAPLKVLTVPRLELCGALVLARLLKKVYDSLNLKFDNCVLWTDSTIVLAWIKMSPHLLKPFVANRVAEIQRLTKVGSWQHVRTKDNPADLLSRGFYPSDLLTANIWWEGPVWLVPDEHSWPSRESVTNEALPELRQQKTYKTCLFTKEEAAISFDRYSSLTRLKRVIAYCLRFKNNCLNKANCCFGPLSLSEVQDAMLALVKVAQRESFSSELNALSEGKLIKSTSKILSLAPFLDKSNVIRVGGRLQNSSLNYDAKHPILLAANHHLTKLIFQHEHDKLFHAGPQLLLSSVRQRFWPTSGKNLARKTVRECIKCFRANPKITNPIMGNLPEQRLIPSHAFSTTGVDYAGPLTIKERKGRGSKMLKCYICLFICFATKALHLELVTDLSTQAFILALRRFISRRGKPLEIWSDNGTNFVGANNKLKELGKFLYTNQNTLSDAFTNEDINWKFIPPHSPHFGGLWEAGVKSTKFHLTRITNNAHVTFEEMYTLLVQIEAILNSRPLCSLSPDPNDMSSLTPAHFLIGRPLNSIPDPDLREIPETRISRYQRIQQLQQQFWARWSREYVTELQQRCKWRQTQADLKEGMMVLIKDENLPPMKWQLGRIVQLYPGKDMVNRVALIKTASGMLKRSFTKICVLPRNTDTSTA